MYITKRNYEKYAGGRRARDRCIKCDKRKTLEKDGQISEDIISKLKWKYKYLASSEIPTKTSVSKLKQMEEGLDIDDLIDEAKRK